MRNLLSQPPFLPVPDFAKNGINRDDFPTTDTSTTATSSPHFTFKIDALQTSRFDG
jgi:hypothetical protein